MYREKRKNGKKRLTKIKSIRHLKLYSMESSFLPIFLSFINLLVIHTHNKSIYCFSNRHYTFKLKGTKLNCLMFYTKSFIIEFSIFCVVFLFLCSFSLHLLHVSVNIFLLSLFFLLVPRFLSILLGC